MTEPVPALPDYDVLDAQLRAAGATQSPAEAHGLLTGLLCAPGEAELLWRGLILDEPSSPEAEALFPELAGLLAQTRAGLDDPGFGFEPLLPPGDAGLARQLEGFTDWCHGFLLGLTAGGAHERRLSADDSGDGGGRAESGTSAEAAEFLKDVVQMSEAEMEAEGADEEDEARALAELVEYLRAGVQLLYDEREPTRKLH